METIGTTDFVLLSVSQHSVCKMQAKKVIKIQAIQAHISTVISLNISEIQPLFHFRKAIREVMRVGRN